MRKIRKTCENGPNIDVQKPALARAFSAGPLAEQNLSPSQHTASFTIINTTKAPLGCSSLVQYLHSRKISADYIYAPKNNDDLYSEKDLEAMAAEVASCDIIGVSLFSISERRAFQLVRFLKNEYPGKHLILGGPSAILDPQRLLAEPGVDSVCVHEGELPLETLIRQYHNGVAQAIPGIIFKGNTNAVGGVLQKPIQDLDEIPFTNYKDGTLGKYKKLVDGSLVTEKNMAERIENPSMQGNFLYVMAARGCPHSCSYCINDTLNGILRATHSKLIRKRTTAQLIGDLKKIITVEKDIDTVFFFDDDFFVRSERELEALSREYKDSVGLPFHIFANPNSTTRKKIDVCHSAGLKKIEFGLQTVSKTVLEKYKRMSGGDSIREIVKYVTDCGYDLDIAIDFISNSPFENDGDVLQNIEYILGLDGNFILDIHNLHLFPGSRLRKEYGAGTGNEHKEYQNNLVEGKIHNEYTTKLLIAMQGLHKREVPDQYGTLTRDEISYFIATMATKYDENLRVLTQKIRNTAVAQFYSQF